MVRCIRLYYAKKQSRRAELMQILCVFCGFLWRKTSWEGVIIVDAMCILRFLEKNKPGGRNFCGDNAYFAAFGEKID